MPASKTKTSVRSLSELAAVVPYTLGYKVSRSVVILGVVDTVVAVTVRCDLGMTREHVDTVLNALSRNGCRPSAFIVFGFEDRALESEPTLDLVSQMLSDAHPDATIAPARVHGGHCYAPDDMHGTPIPDAPPAVAAMVESGIDPLASRTAVDDLYTPAADDANSHEDAPLTPAEIRDAMTVWATIASADAFGVSVSSLSSEQVVLAARLVSSVQGLEHRDAIVGALCGLTPSLVGDEGFATQVRVALGSPVVSVALMARLAEFVRRVPVGLAVPVLTAAGAVAWHAGHGSHASAALEAALRLDPQYRLALILEASVRLGMRPA